MHPTPDVAVMTCFWPDRSRAARLAVAYRAAKERIVRFQDEGHIVVLPADDLATAGFPELTAAALVQFASDLPSDRLLQGVFARAGGRVHRPPEERRVLEEACPRGGAARPSRRSLRRGRRRARAAARDGVERADSLEGALRRALAMYDGAAAAVVSPMFPLPLEQRTGLCALARALSDTLR